MAHVAGHAAESAASLAGRINEYEYDSQKHYTYPETIGGQYNSSLNYNSHQTSEYAIARSDQIDSLSIEPFVLFEFMRINTDKQNEAILNQNEATKQLLTNAELVAEREQLINNQSEDAETEAARVQKFDAKSAENASVPFVLLENGYTDAKVSEMKHDHLIKDFSGLENIIKNYL